MMNLEPLPAFTDNDIWMIDDGRKALVVGPGDAAPVLGAFQQRGLALPGILVRPLRTDHLGGQPELHIHPFLRCHLPFVAAAAQAQGAANDKGARVFAALRQWKNRHR